MSKDAKKGGDAKHTKACADLDAGEHGPEALRGGDCACLVRERQEEAERVARAAAAAAREKKEALEAGAKRRMVEVARLRWVPYFHAGSKFIGRAMLSKPGEFLVYLSSSGFVLAGWADRARLFLVDEKLTDTGVSYRIDRILEKTEWFPSIQKLVEYHMKHGVRAKAETPKLQIETPVPRSRYELDGSDVQIGALIQRGVYRGTFQGKDVALRLCTELKAEDRETFENEAIFALRFKHKNVVEALGLVLTIEVRMVVLELVGPTLQSHLKKEKSTPATLQGFCLDVAQGMKYLEGINYVHRNLNTANCLMGPKQEVKISGLSIEQSGKDGRTDSVRWAAPETASLTYSHKSDVWAFGVLAWVVFSQGDEPYPGLPGQKVMGEVKVGHRMAPPAGTPPPLALAMAKCWEKKPEDRPSFADLVSKLEPRTSTRAPVHTSTPVLSDNKAK